MHVPLNFKNQHWFVCLMRWFIARCPETYEDITGVFTSYSHSTLTQTGVRQARELADVLGTIDEIWTSSSQAAIQASLIVAAGRPIVETLRDLREVEMGKLEGQLPSQAEADYTQACLQSESSQGTHDKTMIEVFNDAISRQIRLFMYLQRNDVRLVTTTNNPFPYSFTLWALCETGIEIEGRVQPVVEEAKQMPYGSKVLTMTHPLLAAYLIERAKYGTTGQNIKRRCERDGFFPLGFNEIAILDITKKGRVRETETVCVPYSEIYRH